MNLVAYILEVGTEHRGSRNSSWPREGAWNCGLRLGFEVPVGNIIPRHGGL